MERTCRDIEPDLIAVAAREAAPAAARDVERHLAGCAPCRDELRRYRLLEGAVADLRREPVADPTLARAELFSRLADLRSRVVAYGLFDSPLGKILIARSELGVATVRYLGNEGTARAHMARLSGGEAVEDEAATRGLFQDVLAYLEGRRVQLDWPLDLRWARSAFERRVLEATAGLPYGAVTSYAGIARRIGAPTATRAVAQALRHNPLPIVIPCHRVIGSGGDLVGYAGPRIDLKERLLALEGVPVATRRHRIDRPHMYVRHLAEVEYCVPSCGDMARRPLAELTLFASRQRAEAAGLAPCSSCRPDLHPLSA